MNSMTTPQHRGWEEQEEDTKSNEGLNNSYDRDLSIGLPEDEEGN
jgi:hypothetical protein